MYNHEYKNVVLGVTSGSLVYETGYKTPHIYQLKKINNASRVYFTPHSRLFALLIDSCCILYLLYVNKVGDRR